MFPGASGWSHTTVWSPGFPLLIYYTEFKVNPGEFKVMGLAPYGEPKYQKLIVDNLIDLKTDGSYRSRSTIGRIWPRSISETHPLSSRP